MRQFDDPRDTITPASFAVAPQLIGTPLAGPMRRALAMAIDLVLAAILANAGGIFFGVVAAILLLRASARPTSGLLKRSFRFGLRGIAAIVLFIVVIGAWDLVASRDDGPGAANVISGLSGTLGVLGDMASLQRAQDEEAAQRAAERLVQRLQPEELSQTELRELSEELDQAVLGLQQDSTGASVSGIVLPPLAVSALRDAVAALDTTTTDTAHASSVDPGALAGEYADALADDDSARSEQVAAALADVVAGDSLAALNQRVTRLQEQNQELTAELARAMQDRPGPIRAFFAFLVDDLGLGAAWFALYFTAFLVLWKGKTPGKWVAKARVVRLDGRPIGWWHAFERFGGYSASLATLGVGFLQIFWDRNRQAIHDKLVETVVIQE